MLKVDVFEKQGRYRAATVEGQHAFMIAVTNQSEEAVWIDAISLTPQTNQLRFTGSDQAIEEILEPGETKDFSIFINVTVIPGSPIYSIDSVDVAITCHTATRKSFNERIAQRVISVD